MSGETDLTQAGFDAIAEAMHRDGSSTAFLYMDELGVRLENGHVTLRLGAGHDRTLTRMLRARVGKGRELFLRGSDTAVLFRPGEQAGACEEDGVTVVLTLPEDALKELCGALGPHAGVCTLSAFPMTVELAPTAITDRSGERCRSSFGTGSWYIRGE